MNLTNVERETFIRKNDASQDWEILTLSRSWARKLKKLGYSMNEDHQGGWFCALPGHAVKIRRPQKPRAGGKPFKARPTASFTEAKV